MSRTARELAAARNRRNKHHLYNVASTFGAFTVAYNDLREWIAALDRAGELRRLKGDAAPTPPAERPRIKVEADPILEITEIADRVSKAERPGQSTLKTYAEPGGP